LVQGFRSYATVALWERRRLAGIKKDLGIDAISIAGETPRLFQNSESQAMGHAQRRRRERQ
jgi:hypothetical protein